MPPIVQGVVGLVYLAVLLGLFVYGLNAYVMVVLHWRHRRRVRAEAPPPPPPAAWPMVTVQLPLYNERYVARRLLAAVARLDYPADRLEIQVLDDSDDETTAIVAETVARLRAAGRAVTHLHRAERTGFKAGALEAGLKEARGEFVAIFDADFVPPPDFLRRTIPHFADPAVAVVQGRWGHLNRDFSLLTMAQALGIDGHFGVEQPARCWGGLLLNFNGTAGVWRKAAIEDAGGWTHDTLTEDLDLSYRAQLRGWRVVYRPELVCPAELPVLITGFKSQQRRWAKGSIQTARKLLPAVLRSSRSPWVKYQAAVHLTYYLIHPLRLAIVLLSAPMVALQDVRLPRLLLPVVTLAVVVATGGPATMLVYGQRVLYADWWRHAWRLPAIMIIGVGVAWSTTLAVLGAFWGHDREFVRTPKFGIGPDGGRWRDKAYRDRRRRGSVVELALGAYCAVAAGLFWSAGHYGTLPFLALYAAGFLTVGVLTLLHARPGTALSALALGLLAVGPASAEDLVAEGERWWTVSPDPGNPVACATCHHEPSLVRGWPAGFPKFKPLPPPHARVMTLMQANAEAVARHYRRQDPRRAATAITAYLTALAAGTAVSPGISAGQPVFPERIAALAASVQRGRRLFDDRCGGCQRAGTVAPRLLGFPRLRDGRAESAESLLEEHDRHERGLRWDDPAAADLAAYLTSHLAGRPLGSPGAGVGKESP